MAVRINQMNFSSVKVPGDLLKTIICVYFLAIVNKQVTLDIVRPDNSFVLLDLVLGMTQSSVRPSLLSLSVMCGSHAVETPSISPQQR